MLDRTLYDKLNSSRFFWDVALGVVNRSMPCYCETIHGTRGLYFVQSKYMGDIFSIETRKYGFFCYFCNDENGCGVHHCENDIYVNQ